MMIRYQKEGGMPVDHRWAHHLFLRQGLANHQFANRVLAILHFAQKRLFIENQNRQPTFSYTLIKPVSKLSC